MAKQTSTQTYRVSDDVDSELRRLAKIHGGIDKALRVLFEWESPLQPFDLKPVSVQEVASRPDTKTCPECGRSEPGHSVLCNTGNRLAAQQQTPGRIPDKISYDSSLLPCRHCGEDGKISPRTNAWRACGSCATDGHLNFEGCRRCFEIAHAKKLAASSTGVDDPSVDYSEKDPA